MNPRKIIRTYQEDEAQLLVLVGEVMALRRENARLLRLGKPKTVKLRTKKPRKITVKDIQGCKGAFPALVSFGFSAYEKRLGQEGAYLAATRRTDVPAHDPAFGRLAA